MSRPISYVNCVTSFAEADNGITYGYRPIGTPGPVPLVLLQHFRGNLDNWDPGLIDNLSRDREVIAFDNVGVGATSGRTPSTATSTEMARDAISFIAALGLPEVDLLGFSIGSFVAQEMALIRTSLVRRLILASAAPRGAAACTAGPITSSTPSAARGRQRTATCTRSSGAAG